MGSMKEQFRAAVERLAAGYDEQKAYLEELGTAPSADELALEFSDTFPVLRSKLTKPAADAASRLDEYLTSISGEENASLWTVSALATAPEWIRARELASEVLRHLA